MLEIVRRLRTIRRMKKMSQLDLSKRTGLNRSYISQVESGVNNPSLKTIVSWSRALGCEIDIIIKDI